MEWLLKEPIPHDYCPYCRQGLVSPADYRMAAIQCLGTKRVQLMDIPTSHRTTTTTSGGVEMTAVTTAAAVAAATEPGETASEAFSSSSSATPTAGEAERRKAGEEEEQEEGGGERGCRRQLQPVYLVAVKGARVPQRQVAGAAGHQARCPVRRQRGWRGVCHPATAHVRSANVARRAHRAAHR